MKRLLFLILFCFLLPCALRGGEAWRDETDGLTDNEFYSIAESFDGKTMYVGTINGLYAKKSTEREWSQVFICRGQYRGVNYICGDKEAVYIATKNGLYVSENSHKNWRRVFQGIEKENYCLFVISDPSKKGAFYLGTLKGLFFTDNGGKSWKKARGILGDSKIERMAIGEARGSKQIFVIGNNELYKTASDFKDYEKIFGSESIKNDASDDENTEEDYQDETVFLLNDIAASGETLYLSTNRGIFTSKDNGISWNRFDNSGLLSRNIKSLLSSSAFGGNIFAGTDKGVFEYSEKENLWNKIYVGMDVEDVKNIILTKNGDLFALCKNRLYSADFFDHSTSGRSAPEADKILSNFNNEPTINETIDMAVQYAEVHPDKIKKWRRGAKFKALFPRVVFGIDHAKSDTYEIYTSGSNSYWVYGPQDATDGWDINFSWDLSDLVWNESQTSIDVRSKLMVQLRDDIVDEVTRTYFERRRLQVELLLDPPAELSLNLKKRLRLQELTATLDGLTGSRFSKSIT